jgi:flagellar export protein FliJ
MKGLPGLIRANRWKLDEAQRRLAEIEALAAGLVDERDRLARRMTEEGAAAAGSLELGRAYSRFLDAAMGRRTRLSESLVELDAQRHVAQDEMREAFRALKTCEILHEKRQRQAALLARRREQMRLDEIAGGIHRAAH